MRLISLSAAMTAVLFAATVAFADTRPAPQTTSSKSSPSTPASVETDAPRTNQGWATRIIKPPRHFSADDRDAALEAIQFTLSEVADGATFVWFTKKSNMKGHVRPTASFRDKDGRICRHLKFSVRASLLLIHKIEGVACRSASGTWSLDG